MIPVKSSNIQAVGYDQGSETLRVAFKSGGTYDYKGVPPDVHASMLCAQSVGSFFHHNVKGKFDSEKVETEQTNSAD
jgi:hypothetical protein